MSRSNNTELVNPAKKFFQWAGETGGFIYFDKDKGEKGERVLVPLPFRFLVLDTLSTIRGFDDPNKSGYWSNEVRDLSKEIFIVKNKNGVVSKGLYETLNINGAKYCQSVYIAYKEDDGLHICNIQIIGAALGAWIDFRKKNKIFDGAIEVATQIQGKKGITVYQIPVFKKIETTPETDSIAKELDIELQTYLNAYFKNKTAEVIEKQTEDKVFEKSEVEKLAPEVADDLPF